MGAAGHDFPRTSTNICCGGQLTGIRSFSAQEIMKNPWENPHLRKRLHKLIHSFLSVIKGSRLLKCHLFLVKQQWMMLKKQEFRWVGGFRGFLKLGYLQIIHTFYGIFHHHPTVLGFPPRKTARYLPWSDLSSSSNPRMAPFPWHVTKRGNGGELRDLRPHLKLDCHLWFFKQTHKKDTFHGSSFTHFEFITLDAKNN